MIVGHCEQAQTKPREETNLQRRCTRQLVRSFSSLLGNASFLSLEEESSSSSSSSVPEERRTSLPFVVREEGNVRREAANPPGIDRPTTSISRIEEADSPPNKSVTSDGRRAHSPNARLLARED